MASTPPTSLLEIVDLTVRLPGSRSRPDAGRLLLDSVSMSLEPGKITGIAGESGSGKTMTGLAVMGLLPSGLEASGQVNFGGRNLLGLDAKRLNLVRGNDLTMIFQDPSTSMHPMLKVGVQLTDHLRHHLGLSKRDAMARAAGLLETVQIPDPADALTKFPHQFSGGMRQRIAIAIALACDPQVIIADEPTTALDVTVQAGVLRLLRQLCDDLDIAIMLVTHDLGVMSAIADEVTVMRYGQIVEKGPRFDVLTDPQHGYTRELIAALPGNSIAGRSGSGAPTGFGLGLPPLISDHGAI